MEMILVQFERHEREGIETVHFAEMLIVSGQLHSSRIEIRRILFDEGDE